MSDIKPHKYTGVVVGGPKLARQRAAEFGIKVTGVRPITRQDGATDTGVDFEPSPDIVVKLNKWYTADGNTIPVPLGGLLIWSEH